MDNDDATLIVSDGETHWLVNGLARIDPVPGGGEGILLAGLIVETMTTGDLEERLADSNRRKRAPLSGV